MRSWVGLWFVHSEARSNLGTLLCSAAVCLQTAGDLNCEASPSRAWQMSSVISVEIEMSVLSPWQAGGSQSQPRLLAEALLWTLPVSHTSRGMEQRPSEDSPTGPSSSPASPSPR